MLQKALAGLLIFSWIVLSGFDVLEDLDLPDQVEIRDSNEAPLPGNGSAGLLARNIVETATHAGIRCSNLLEQFTAPTTIYTPHSSQRVSKLHKVHHVFII
jgi:hypothetical protein